MGYLSASGRSGARPLTTPHTGGCLCGALRYTADVSVSELRACHCTNCQKGSGTAGSVNAVIPSAAFKLTRGTLKCYGSTADSGRTLNRSVCGDCGSPIYSQRATALDTLVLRAGSLDDSTGMKITANIWTRSARPWAYIDPASKQLPGQPDAPPATT
jgi:hypothetical protein